MKNCKIPMDGFFFLKVPQNDHLFLVLQNKADSEPETEHFNSICFGRSYAWMETLALIYDASRRKVMDPVLNTSSSLTEGRL
ncbi:hypothetical protein CEXT_33701 [Caerostris extrusa]|uniref:Uncharacterized protein n=1 Tax=Caerostris extrusa TaxID=172846 RepID=A0AAV4PS02_CAEEX|nr:hypothetical protein CEXT_33701 [Caerostris extrusa]